MSRKGDRRARIGARRTEEARLRLAELVGEVEANGWTVEFAEWCEDTEAFFDTEVEPVLAKLGIAHRVTTDTGRGTGDEWTIELGALRKLCKAVVVPGLIEAERL